MGLIFRQKLTLRPSALLGTKEAGSGLCRKGWATRREIFRFLETGKSLLEKYRLLLIKDKREVEDESVRAIERE